MILKEGKEYFPVDFGEMIRDGKTYYSRNARDRPYFYLILRTQENTPEPIPANP